MTIISGAYSAPLKVMRKQSGRHESSYFIAAASSAVSSQAFQCCRTFHQDIRFSLSWFRWLNIFFTVLGCYSDGHTQGTEEREA